MNMHKNVLMEFLSQVGSRARKYHRGPKSRFSVTAFDLQGQISRSKGQIRSFFRFFQKWSTIDIFSDPGYKKCITVTLKAFISQFVLNV